MLSAVRVHSRCEYQHEGVMVISRVSLTVTEISHDSGDLLLGNYFLYRPISNAPDLGNASPLMG